MCKQRLDDPPGCVAQAERRLYHDDAGCSPPSKQGHAPLRTFNSIPVPRRPSLEHQHQHFNTSEILLCIAATDAYTFQISAQQDAPRSRQYICARTTAGHTGKVVCLYTGDWPEVQRYRKDPVSRPVMLSYRASPMAARGMGCEGVREKGFWERKILLLFCKSETR